MVEEAGSGVAERESVNEYREKMMSKAIARVCTLSREEYKKKVRATCDFIIFTVGRMSRLDCFSDQGPKWSMDGMKGTCS